MSRQTVGENLAFELCHDNSPSEEQIANAIDNCIKHTLQKATPVVIESIPFNYNEIYLLRHWIGASIIEADDAKIPRDHESSIFRDALYKKLTGLLVKINERSSEGISAGGVPGSEVQSREGESPEPQR